MLIPFLTLSLAFLVAATYLIFRLLTDLLKADRRGQIILAAGLVFLGVGFFISVPLIRVNDSHFVQWLYIFFSLWAGLLFYVFWAALILQILKWLRLKLNYRLLSGVGVFLALVIFLIGVVHAFSPRVTHLTLKLDNLSPYWQGKRLVQLSDLHLGGAYGPKFLGNLIQRVNNLEPDLIFFTGDLFDGGQRNLRQMVGQLSQLETADGVIYISGNHDHYAGADTLEELIKKENVVVLNDRAVMLDGLEIIGLAYHPSDGRYLRPEVENLMPDNGQVRILLKHIPTDIEYSKSLGADLQLSGHTHRGQMFPLGIITGFMFNPYNYGWRTEGNFSIYTSSGIGTWGPPLRPFNPSEIVVIDLE